MKNKIIKGIVGLAAGLSLGILLFSSSKPAGAVVTNSGTSFLNSVTNATATITIAGLPNGSASDTINITGATTTILVATSTNFSLNVSTDTIGAAFVAAINASSSALNVRASYVAGSAVINLVSPSSSAINVAAVSPQNGTTFTIATSSPATPTQDLGLAFSYSFLTAAGSTSTLKSGAGTLNTITIEPIAGATTTNITVFDSLVGSGTKIASFVIQQPATGLQPVNVILNVGFTTGLTIVQTGATSTITTSFK